MTGLSITTIVSGAAETSRIEPADRGGRDDLGRDQEPANAGARHDFGLAELRAGDPERTGAHLTAGDLRAAMRLRVGPEVLAGRARVRGHAAEIPLEAIEIQQQRGCWNVVARHRRRLRCWMPLVTS